MAKGDYKYIVTFDTKKGKAAIKEFDEKVDKLGKTSKTAAGGFKTLAAKVAVGVAAFYAASKALKGVIRWMGDAVDKAAIQEQAEVDLKAALESTGREVAANAEHFKKYASELQSATTSGDEQIISAQTLMLQLTKLDREGIDVATKGAMGLAVVFKQDLSAATTLVAKALAGSFGVLGRYGITVDATLSKEEKRAQLLEKLLVLFERAKAKTGTYRGAVEQLSNVYGDLKEIIGDAIIKNEAIRDAIKNVKEEITKFIETGKAKQAVADVTLHISAIGEEISWIGKAFKKTDEFLFGWADSLKEGRNITEKYAEANEKLRESLARAGIELITNKEGFEELAGAVINTKTKIEKLSFIEIDWEGLKPPSELMADWEALFALVETPELDLAFEQFAISTEDNFANVMEGMGFFVRDSKEKAEQYEEIMGGMTEAQKEFSAVALGELMNMEAGLKGMVDAILNTFEKWALGAIVKSTMALAFPANLIASAVGIAAVKAIFAGIKSMETGGTIEREGIYHLHAGETVTPVNRISKVSNVYSQTEGARFYSTVNIYAQRLDDSTINQAGEKIFHAVSIQARRHGYKMFPG